MPGIYGVPGTLLPPVPVGSDILASSRSIIEPDRPQIEPDGLQTAPNQQQKNQDNFVSPNPENKLPNPTQNKPIIF